MLSNRDELIQKLIEKVKLIIYIADGDKEDFNKYTDDEFDNLLAQKFPTIDTTTGFMHRCNEIGHYICELNLHISETYCLYLHGCEMNTPIYRIWMMNYFRGILSQGIDYQEKKI